MREKSRTREGARARQGEAKKPRSAKPAAERKPRPAVAPRPKPAEAPRQPTRAEAKAAAQETLATGVQTLVVEPDEADMRVDRFLVARFPQLAFTHIQRIVRKGELRVDGKRAQPNDRLLAGQKVRIPPLKLDQPKLVARSTARDQSDRDFLKSITLYEDKDVLIINKPMGLAVQGGSGTTRHVDGLLDSMRDAEGQKPRLVHRLDKDTAGCLVIAKTRFAASTMAKSFRSRTTRKIYWALVAGVPRVRQGRISTYLAKEGEEGDARMRVAKHGDEGASHALTYYAVVDTAAHKLAWLSLKPVTGRTHQLRAHAAHIGHPIVGDPKYFDIENWELPGGIQNKLHLLARRIVIAHPRTGKPIDVTAPLPPHMQQSFNLLGFDTGRYDPIVDAPEE
ncbi:RluA family pseudouridine synthase [Microvirga sp. 17 mud 1-3]|uniref:RluA family pseudouridine synthase n=1 Tax=Microvirga sp. 17 mud 1-3 TaxID=2082949 RepID=UPI001FDED129|nr:RluA family pseudouridine synthase [Microvirga sp. 17 mud 1-3]